MVERSAPVGLTEDVCQFGKMLSPYFSIRNAYPANRFRVASKVIPTFKKSLPVSKNDYQLYFILKYNYFGRLISRKLLYRMVGG